MNSFPIFIGFCFIFVARILAALYLHITDCDETYNYWEPMHYLMYGKGLQTWEYSPIYGLRSYLYLLVHAIPATIIKLATEGNATSVFYGTRFLLAAVSAVLETTMFKSIRRNFGIFNGNLWLIFQTFSPGMYISSTAFLPSTFSMFLTMAFLTAWWSKKFKIAIFSIVVSTFIGWPFAALLSAPFLYVMLIQHRLFKIFIYWSGLFSVCVGVPLLITDSFFYGKLTFAPLNIVLYNIFSSHGPNLFGVESKYFYFVNLFLNFNVVWFLALMYPLITGTKVLVRTMKPKKGSLRWDFLLKTSPLYIWILVFFMQPHKEERFMFPIYPLISLCGALSVSSIFDIVSFCTNQNGGNNRQLFLRKLTVYGLNACFIILSLSRMLALYRNYNAPMEIATQLDSSDVEKSVCLGKEWHRFPGSFFIPTNYRLRFISSHFDGILPAYFDETEKGSTIVHNYFNNLNQADSHMLFDYSKCDYLIDLDLGNDHQYDEVEPNYSRDDRTWTIIKSVPFLDYRKSHSMFRAFYIPFINSRLVRFGRYNLLKRKL